MVNQQRSLCSGIFAEKVESDVTRLEVTPLEAPRRNGKTERVGKDWKEDYYKMTQDGPEAQAWTDFEEDCCEQSQSAKNQRQRVQCVPTCFRQESSSDGRCCFGVWRSRPRRSEPAADRRIGTGTVDDNETHCPTGKPGIGVTNVGGNEPCTPQRNTTRANCTLDNLSSVGTRGANEAKRTTSAFWHPGVVISNMVATVWIAYRGSVVKCAQSKVRPFTEDDEAAHEHITEHMRHLGERLLHEGDFSYEDITGQDEPPVDSPPAPEENTATGHQKQDGEGQMDVDPASRRRMRGKTRLTSLEQPSAPTANTSPDITQQETKEDHDDKR